MIDPTDQMINNTSIDEMRSCVPDSGRLTPFNSLNAASNAAPQPAPSAPEGWKLVPVDPTDEMIFTIRETCWKASGGQLPAYREVYAAMLAAAPEAPEAPKRGFKEKKQ